MNESMQQNQEKTQEKRKKEQLEQMHENLPIPDDFIPIQLQSSFETVISEFELEVEVEVEVEVEQNLNRLLRMNCMCCSGSNNAIKCLILLEEMNSLPYIWEKPTEEKYLKEWNDQVENHKEQKHYMIQKHIKQCLYC